ncbi:MAG: prepilin-type N-terminal cleavage/methylation domain-containing protein [bacterium]|nr:prepilin-type N-terminal cleavage/methylation domain-containing protein [bacterium]
MFIQYKKNIKPDSKVRGFTLIEVMIVVGILAGLAGLGLFVSVDLYKSYTFYSERNIVISIIQKARNQSLVNINESKHGVYLESGRYTIFQGENYVSRNAVYDEIIEAGPTISRTGLTEIVFDQLNGNPNITGNITLSEGLRSSIISIENEGRINW